MTDIALPASFGDPAVPLYYDYLSVPLRHKTRQDEMRQDEARQDEAGRPYHYRLEASHQVAVTVGGCVAPSPTPNIPVALDAFLSGTPRHRHPAFGP